MISEAAVAMGSLPPLRALLLLLLLLPPPLPVGGAAIAPRAPLARAAAAVTAASEAGDAKADCGMLGMAGDPAAQVACHARRTGRGGAAETAAGHYEVGLAHRRLGQHNDSARHFEPFPILF